MTLPWWDWTSTSSHRHGLPTAYTTPSDEGENPLAGGSIDPAASAQGGAGAPTATVTEPTAYALFDGLFRRALLHHLAGSERALPELSDAVLATLPRLVA